MQEIKTEEINFPFDDFSSMDYECQVFGQKSYNGVAIISKNKLTNIKKDRLAVKLIDMGLFPGKEIKLLFKAPFGDPIAIDVQGYTLSLRRKEAALIAVA